MTGSSTIHIRQGLVTYRSADQEKLVTASDGLKNKFRRSTIPITEASLWQRLREAPTAVESGGKIIPTDFAFHSLEGKAYQPNNWAHRVFRPFMWALYATHPDIPVLTPNELRHTRATLWIAQGMDPYMAARLLDHSDLKMLAKIYDHTQL